MKQLTSEQALSFSCAERVIAEKIKDEGKFYPFNAEQLKLAHKYAHTARILGSGKNIYIHFQFHDNSELNILVLR